MQYKKIGQALIQHLGEAKVETTEKDLIEWYAKQNQEDFASEEERRRIASIIIGRLIENEGTVTIVKQAVNSSGPEKRVLRTSGK